ncbi:MULTISPECIES: hypothetical protein [unclassified Cupriavidus]|uniref:hypothetical protein n=1 Tax=unclassified Cupriavidus TaxID=2640874 RepID=UPI0012695AA7|nr:hypothetical protein [Cupriavidus sp. SK-3]
MTAPAGNELRDLLADDAIPTPKLLNGQGFQLRPSRVKVYKPSGAPVYFYDVMTDSNTRVGIANLILEKDSQQVSEIGHVCARLLEDQYSTELLKQVAELLISHGHECGLTEICIVVPEQSEESVNVCESIGKICNKANLDRDGEKFVWFEYSANGNAEQMA